MAVGQHVTKQTWLLGDVEVRGIVALNGLSPGEDVGTGDTFDILPDPEYQHLVNLIPGSHGKLKCETYPLPAEHTNHDESWPLPQKDGAVAFEVIDPTTGQRRNLRVGDHVRIEGRWTIDHHPEDCVTRNRGLLRIGCVWPELHPFRWDTIVLASPVSQSSTLLSLAAPIHEESYLGNGKWLANEAAGVASKIFITDDGSNYHNEMSVTLTLPAPALPNGWTGDPALITVAEAVSKNAGSNGPGVRTITRTANGATVEARVSPFPTIDVGGFFVADTDGPGRGDGIFQARYTVSWGPRLTVEPITIKLNPGESARDFEIVIRNVGPDRVQITDVRLADIFGPVGDPTVFVIPNGAGTEVPPRGAVTLNSTFTPHTSGLHRATNAREMR